MITAHPAWAKTYKWVDEKGVTQYGDAIPPQYAGKGNAELNNKGVVIKKTQAAPTLEQRKENEEALAKRQAEVQKTLEQTRKDKALLNSYTDEREIDLARDRNLQQEDAQIQNLLLQAKSAQKKLDQYNKQAKAIESHKKPIPPDLAKDIDQAQREKGRLEAQVKQKQQTTESIRASFDADKVRFRELKQNGLGSKN
jgi:hypothetical protein